MTGQQAPSAGTPRQRLEEGLHPHERRILEQLLDDLERGYAKWVAGVAPVGPTQLGDEVRLVHFLMVRIREHAGAIEVLRRGHRAFVDAFDAAPSFRDRENVMMDYAASLGASAGQIASDRRALARSFGPDALTDRFTRRLAATERALAMTLGRLGAVAARTLRRASGVPPVEAWRTAALEPVVGPLLSHDGDSRVRVAAFRSLTEPLLVLPPDQAESALGEAMVQFVYRAAQDRTLDTWIQCEALALLAATSGEHLAAVGRRRLSERGTGDDAFVRRRLVQLLADGLARAPRIAELIGDAAADASPFVRQRAARLAARAEPDTARRWIDELARRDAARPVRIAALLEATAWAARPEMGDALPDLLVGAMQGESDETVLRTATHVAVETVRIAVDARHDRTAAWGARLLDALAALHRGAASHRVRRWAGIARELAWCELTPPARALRPRVAQLARSIPAGGRARFPAGWARDGDEMLGRVLSVVAHDDHGLELERGLFGSWLYRGHRFGFRTWRLLHELTHPAPDKRQAISHTVGRHFRGQVRAPSAIMAELTETKVPGEPLVIPEEGGWRPYLPLVDEALSALDHGLLPEPIRFYTSEGVTTLRAPASPLRKLSARARLTAGFAGYAHMRNWRPGQAGHAGDYVAALRDLGFTVEFAPHAAEAGPVADPNVQTFFPALFPVTLSDAWRQWADYFQTYYGNSMPELLLFAGAMAGVFLGSHWYAHQSVRRARARIPLVVGGWGTRGKSGTERLKAALFNALGYAVVSKTTGCEAMIVTSYPFGKLHELFLYRPYDKATIWEMRDVVLLAERLGAEVMLWECMALNPELSSLLQHQWMRDDASTITNTYPDHEDIQGPAGVNIPQVISEFVPPQSRLFTSEDAMVPILRDRAAVRGTSVTETGWLDAALLTDDMLARFPYSEHPSNVALVLSLAASFGVDRDFALKEMADRVVPDLGVLRIFPRAHVHSRFLEFANGFSANEEKAAMENWERLGYGAIDREATPAEWVTTLVNNRYDRVPRSKVFARVLVSGMSADRHFLMGSNVTGLLGYIEDAFREHAAHLSLWAEESVAPLAALERQARWLRVPRSPGQVRARIEPMLAAAGIALSPEELTAALAAPDGLAGRLGGSPLAPAIEAHAREAIEAQREYAALAASVDAASPGQRRELDRALHAFFWKWLSKKLVVVEDDQETGERLLRRLARETPPGYLNRIMGIQNIKGPGIDFVHRWQAWDICRQACLRLRTLERFEMERGLKELRDFVEHGHLTEEYVRETLAAVRASPAAQTEAMQAALDVLAARCTAAMQAIEVQVTGAAGRSWAARLLDKIEAFLDPGDAIRRRKRSAAIYDDLVRQQIAPARAAEELRALVKRQKGGWLAELVARTFRPRRPAPGAPDAGRRP